MLSGAGHDTMTLPTVTMRRRARGFSLLEVLITLIVLAFGLLGLINLQIKLHMNEVESYQRAQAVVLLHDMVSRLQVNQARAADYVTPADSWFGVAGGEDCTKYGIDAADPVRQDVCAWSTLLQGASVQQGADALGAMIGARGCVEQLQLRDPTDGICQPGVYRVSVAWQGLVESASPAEACGRDQFGAEGNRRVISSLVSLGVPGCL